FCRSCFFSACPAPSYSYPLSLHDALPISERPGHRGYSSRYLGHVRAARLAGPRQRPPIRAHKGPQAGYGGPAETTAGECSADMRSEEHTSELQSRFDLVCRLLLEKKKIYN